MRYSIWLSLSLTHCTLLTGALNKDCGDGFLQSPQEVCDDGNLNNGDGCSEACLPEAICGDGAIDESEACDDGNIDDGDGCNSNCQIESICGNNIPEPPEDCDDGNLLNGDGCSDACAFEFICGNNLIELGEECDDGNIVSGDGCSANCEDEDELCDNGLIDADEQCDDGNQSNNDDCTNLCQSANCGDGFVFNQGPGNNEECDDGNSTNGDGCSSCLLDLCGDGVVQAGEECDDGNSNNGDGCSSACAVELSLCGNGLPNAGEECDDANAIDNDQCKNNCAHPKIIEITAGDVHTCALTEFGSIKCWGNAISGQLGYGNTTDIGDAELPSTVGFVSTGAVISSFDAGSAHGCALNDTGDVLCWGNGASGRLGYGNTVSIGINNVPSSVGFINFGASNIVQVSTGDAHTCAVFDNEVVQCWGDNFFGQLGYGNTTDIGDNEPPFGRGAVDLGNSSQEAAQVTAGAAHTCIIVVGGAIRCWGRGALGRLGYGNEENIGDEPSENSQIADVFSSGTATLIAAGGAHTCAVFDDGSLRCWGSNNFGQLGIGNINNIGDNELPISIAAIDLDAIATQVTLGGNHTCALLDDDTIKCWGRNNKGQLGQGNTADFGDNTGELPSSLSAINVGGDVDRITAGLEHTCALLNTGKIRCWGNGSNGRLGYGNEDDIGVIVAPNAAGDVPLF